MPQPKTVTEYIAQAPSWARPTLKELRSAIKSAAPYATESISYHMPYYAQNGRLAYFGVYTAHCSFHWISTEDKKNFAKEISKQKVVNTTLHIPRGEKVPATLIKKLVKARIKNNELRKQKSSKSHKDQ